tara:strand:+ start:146 stop:418 length:273 start_codon:yes stop_codon:yes gene_type:complete
LFTGLKLISESKTNILKNITDDMAEINTSVDIIASVDTVWNIISDLDNEPKFWKGTKETRTISKDGNEITREIIIAFRDSKCIAKNYIVS